MNLLDPIPTEQLSPSVRSKTRARRSTATWCSASRSSTSIPPDSRSTKASSRLSGSTRGDSSRRVAITTLEDSRYAWNRPERKAAWGARRRACAPAMAEWTPNLRAS